MSRLFRPDVVMGIPGLTDRVVNFAAGQVNFNLDAPPPGATGLVFPRRGNASFVIVRLTVPGGDIELRPGDAVRGLLGTGAGSSGRLVSTLLGAQRLRFVWEIGGCEYIEPSTSPGAPVDSNVETHASGVSLTAPTLATQGVSIDGASGVTAFLEATNPGQTINSVGATTGGGRWYFYNPHTGLWQHSGEGQVVQVGTRSAVVNGIVLTVGYGRAFFCPDNIVLSGGGLTVRTISTE